MAFGIQFSAYNFWQNHNKQQTRLESTSRKAFIRPFFIRCWKGGRADFSGRPLGCQKGLAAPVRPLIGATAHPSTPSPFSTTSPNDKLGKISGAKIYRLWRH